MRFKDWPAWTFLTLGVFTLGRVDFGEDFFLLVLGSAEIMIALLAFIHSDA
jgi:hypothetical protein